MKESDPISINHLTELLASSQQNFGADDLKKIEHAFSFIQKQTNGTFPQKQSLEVISILLDEIGLGVTSVICGLFATVDLEIDIEVEDARAFYGDSVADIIHGLEKSKEVYRKSASVETDNFRKLLLTFARDIRVIFILLAKRLYLMRNIKSEDTEMQINISRETSYLYAPLAHRLGLYRIKSELEDLSLKYTNRKTYSEIAERLHETKRSREGYIDAFIQPIKEKLEAQGFKFTVKGRTKTIFSILNKIRTKDTPFEDIYDLFAIRIILDVEGPEEKAVCWRAYSIVTDMYSPNPRRLRDWLSIPKSNGYESLHTTVMGKDGKWVEVQIRTKRMDDIAEKGLAAHYLYKGLKQEQTMDNWLNSVREIIENPEKSAVDVMEEFKMGLYEKEVFVFTPTGDLRKLPFGATVLDFAFEIHTQVGSKCIGGRVNGKNVTIKHQLKNGDQVEITTSNSQQPKQEWLNVVATSKAKNKIRQSLNEQLKKEAELGREMLRRRFKNWKINLVDGTLQKVAKKLKFKTTTEMYYALSMGDLDLHEVREVYYKIEAPDPEPEQTPIDSKTADLYENTSDENAKGDDVLVIDKDLKGVEYSLSKCCNPIYGDEVFGFVSSKGGIKVHRFDCPNAPQMISRFGYRIVKAQWAGKSGTQYQAVLRVTGVDDIGIVSNISQLISKDLKVRMRSINIDSRDGVFHGNIALFISDLDGLKMVIKKINAIKGVHSVQRIDG